MNELGAFLRESVSKIDLVVWAVVLPFFVITAFINGGQAEQAFLGACGIVLAMYLVGTSVEILIATLRNVRGIGTIVGFLTNGPELLVLVIGLLSNDIIFASSTPLGSNLMNVLLLLAASMLARRMKDVWGLNIIYRLCVFVITISLALSFYLIEEALYFYWVVLVVAITVYLFITRPDDEGEDEDVELAISRVWFLPAMLTLILTGFLLDFMVTYTSEASRAPKGIIGFLILSTLTSWPEFKSTLSMLRQDMPKAALLNIIVSNITNLWLAALGVLIYLLS